MNITDVSSTKSNRDTTPGSLNQPFLGLTLFMLIFHPFLKGHHFVFPKLYPSSKLFPVPSFINYFLSMSGHSDTLVYGLSHFCNP